MNYLQKVVSQELLRGLGFLFREGCKIKTVFPQVSCKEVDEEEDGFQNMCSST
jgi:hypothetical protein